MGAGLYPEEEYQRAPEKAIQTQRYKPPRCKHGSVRGRVRGRAPHKSSCWFKEGNQLSIALLSLILSGIWSYSLTEPYGDSTQYLTPD